MATSLTCIILLFGTAGAGVYGLAKAAHMQAVVCGLKAKGIMRKERRLYGVNMDSSSSIALEKPCSQAPVAATVAAASTSV